jgi:hypothetical protein
LVSADPRILRLIRQWLRAGVLESGEWRETDEGTPQGAGISPILSHFRQQRQSAFGVFMGLISLANRGVSMRQPDIPAVNPGIEQQAATRIGALPVGADRRLNGDNDGCDCGRGRRGCVYRRGYHR